MSDEQPLEPYRPPQAEAELRKRAEKRLKRKKELKEHASAYTVIMTMLVVIWAVTTAPGYFWPIWPMLGWGVGLTFHALSLRWDEKPNEAQIEAEAERLRRLEAKREERRRGPQDTV